MDKSEKSLDKIRKTLKNILDSTGGSIVELGLYDKKKRERLVISLEIDADCDVDGCDGDCEFCEEFEEEEDDDM